VEKANYSLTRLCRALDVSRAGFYAWHHRPESQRRCEDRRLTVAITAFHQQSRGNYGSPRLLADLLEAGERVSRKRVARLMRQEGLKGRVRRRYKCTTMSEHDQPIAPNLLDRDFTADAPNQRWVGDTTELLLGNDGKFFLATILDLYSRFVVGWAISAVNDRHLTLRALNQAVRRRCPESGLLHHSDQGSTYASEDYRRALDERGITCSMSRRGDCYDNAVIESWHSTLKAELGERFASLAEAKYELFDYIEVFYNQRRRHSTLGQVSPAVYERRMADAQRPAA
jgi:putative transposase